MGVISGDFAKRQGELTLCPAGLPLQTRDAVTGDRLGATVHMGNVSIQLVLLDVRLERFGNASPSSSSRPSIVDAHSQLTYF